MRWGTLINNIVKNIKLNIIDKISYSRKEKNKYKNKN